MDKKEIMNKVLGELKNLDLGPELNKKREELEKMMEPQKVLRTIDISKNKKIQAAIKKANEWREIEEARVDKIINKMKKEVAKSKLEAEANANTMWAMVTVETGVAINMRLSEDNKTLEVLDHSNCC